MKRSKSKFLVVLVFVVGFVVFILLHIFHTYCLQSSILRYKILNEHSVRSDKEAKASKVKHILFWTNFFDVRFWGMKTETYLESDLKSIGCPETNCIFTHDKTHLEHPHDYDAIVFHGAEMWNFLDLPQTRQPKQLYVMASLE